MSRANQYRQNLETRIETWNKVSDEYNVAAYWNRLENQANLQRLLSHIGDPNGKRIVEVGCGSGFTSLALAERGAECTLLDVSPTALRIAVEAFARAGMPDPECHREDALQSSVPSDAFDVVWNIGVIEHFHGSEKELLIKEMLRMAKPGGQVIILAPNAWCWQFQLLQTWQKLLGTWRYGFEDDMSPARLRRMCRRLGLRDFSVYAYDPVEGWDRLPRIGRILTLGGNTLEGHSRRSRLGFMSFLAIRK